MTIRDAASLGLPPSHSNPRAQRGDLAASTPQDVVMLGQSLEPLGLMQASQSQNAVRAGLSPVPIGPGTQVLEIGDSHTVGPFGHELDRLLRETGCDMSTVGSAGASAVTYTNEAPTRSGYWRKWADGREENAGTGEAHATPKLVDLIASEKPDVLLINLGANFRGGNVMAQVKLLGDIAKEHDLPLVWVGPPKTRQDVADPSSIEDFDRRMAEAVSPYGSYLASSPFTPEYAGNDGIHYGGPRGRELARNWAAAVYREVTGAR